MELSIKHFFSKCDLTFTEEILNGNFIFCARKAYLGGNLYTEKHNIAKKKILTIAGVVMRYNDLFQFSQTNCIHMKIVSLKKSDLHNTSLFLETSQKKYNVKVVARFKLLQKVLENANGHNSFKLISHHGTNIVLCSHIFTNYFDCALQI